MSQTIDLGHGHKISIVDGAVPRVGAIVTHGEDCESYIGFDPKYNTDPATWTVESWEPLTISPSLACIRCGDHGFIRDGKWVPA